MALDYSADGRLLAMATNCNKVLVRDLTTGARAEGWPRTVLDGGKEGDQVMVLRFSPDGKRLALGSMRGKLALFDVDNAKQAESHDAHRKHVGR